jgi:hypothetical protein
MTNVLNWKIIARIINAGFFYCLHLQVHAAENEHRVALVPLADQALDIRALKDVLAKNGYGPR